MLCFPNCKINLGLYVTRKRDDGYHDIETVFYPVQLHDILEIVPSNKTSLEITGLEIQGNKTDNLVWKAYELISKSFPDKVPPLDIYLHKIIPMGAGLGGGSANGAIMLRLLNDYCNLGLNDEALISLALQLGSDCPFFIHNTPQFATGRGEQMSSTPIDLSSYSIQLICPGVHVSTGKAFQIMTPRPAAYDLRTLHKLSIESWREYISNDFEPVVFGQYPVLADIKSQLYLQGAIYASMSGSGSAIFGIFPKNKKAIVNTTIAFQDFYIP